MAKPSYAIERLTAADQLTWVQPTPMLPLEPLQPVAGEPLEGEVVSVPLEAKVAANALRTAAMWLPDEYRDLLREAADGAEKAWDGGCCPVCQETWCDDGCPLEEVRAKLMKEQP